MAKLHELEKYLNYEFSTGCYTGKDYLTFQRKYINYLRALCKERHWSLMNIGKITTVLPPSLKHMMIFTFIFPFPTYGFGKTNGTITS